MLMGTGAVAPECNIYRIGPTWPNWCFLTTWDSSGVGAEPPGRPIVPPLWAALPHGGIGSPPYLTNSCPSLYSKTCTLKPVSLDRSWAGSRCRVGNLYLTVVSLAT